VGRLGDDDGSTPNWRVSLRKSNNPYATHFYEPEGPRDLTSTRAPDALPSQTPVVNPIPAAAKTISKADFESGCRSIFRRYMPEGERTKSRPHHQDFVRRNSLCSPERRYALLQELRRYDLSDEPGLQTYFNYEEDAFTEAKLKAIEESVKKR
jgi:hypothetical protein